MDNIFSYIIKVVILFFGGKLCGYFCIGILISSILVFVCQLIYSIKKLKPSNSAYAKFAVYTSILTIVVSICEYLVSGKIFINFYFICLYFLFSFILSFSFALILKHLDRQIVKKVQNNKQKSTYSLENDIKLSSESVTKRAILHLKETEQNNSVGYIDVGYIKELISLVKEKEISATEETELEEFEIYLMNFCQKQPNCDEKGKLSIYLSSLMKKLAHYKIVC